ncbi:hypothetical protein KCP70_05830 [Salmonella enterica subsp. enterica]|nr:hypothetical protein KCP70_05830 [Salmonella enterica subsp. enterica]
MRRLDRRRNHHRASGFHQMGGISPNSTCLTRAVTTRMTSTSDAGGALTGAGGSYKPLQRDFGARGLRSAPMWKPGGAAKTYAAPIPR